MHVRRGVVAGVGAGVHEGLAPVPHWAGRHLDRPLTVDDLARRAAGLPHHFAARLGTFPADHRRAFRP
ncbi:hypothetical protein [Embleya sp. MST-111070]|uniref:hypothetical protein n=1 Tax=Embleya sp. MST-111070 TaxID=3398231 RepID=UPI003F73A2B4